MGIRFLPNIWRICPNSNKGYGIIYTNNYIYDWLIILIYTNTVKFNKIYKNAFYKYIEILNIIEILQYNQLKEYGECRACSELITTSKVTNITLPNCIIKQHPVSLDVERNVCRCLFR